MSLLNPTGRALKRKVKHAPKKKNNKKVVKKDN